MADIAMNITNATGESNTTSTESSEKISLAEKELFKMFIYPFILLIIIMVFGLLANSIVLYIFHFKWKPTKTAVFILVLGWLDIVNCLFIMPVEAYILYKPLSFDHNILCKITRYSSYVVTASYSFVLVAIAFDRYILVCRPFTSMNTSYGHAVRTCLIAISLAALSQLPSIVMYGTVPVPAGSVVGKTCLIASKNTTIIQGFFVFLLIGHIVIFLLFVIFYTLIGRKLYISHQFGNLQLNSRSQINRHGIISAVTGVIPKSPNDRLRGALANSRTSLNDISIYSVQARSNEILKVSTGNYDEIKDTDKKFKSGVDTKGNHKGLCSKRSSQSLKLNIQMAQELSDEIDPNSQRSQTNGIRGKDSSVGNNCMELSLQADSGNYIRQRVDTPGIMASNRSIATSTPTDRKEFYLKQNTLIMRMVTLTFEFCYLPFLIIVIIRYSNPSIPYSLAFTNRVVYEIFRKSYFFSSIIRPLIYMAMNRDYRDRVCELFCCKKKRQSPQETFSRF